MMAKARNHRSPFPVDGQRAARKPAGESTFNRDTSNNNFANVKAV
jgi:hypothetical protein